MTRVLVFEDESTGLPTLVATLRRLGAGDIASAPDGVAGLAIFDRMKPPPALVVCDIFMPEKDGIEIVNALVERRYSGDLILVSNGDTQLLQIAETIAMGCGLNYLGRLEKPLDEVMVENLYRQFINRGH